jgi:hypothetical protein
VKPQLGEIVGYQGIDFRVEGLLDYRLSERAFRLARLVGGGQVRFLEIPDGDLAGRVLVLGEIAALDIAAPPPATIYHGGESFLLRLAGTAQVSVAGDVPGRSDGLCGFWRYRAAGDRFLQIEAGTHGIRMLEGASVHQSMIETRSSTPKHE